MSPSPKRPSKPSQPSPVQQPEVGDGVAVTPNPPNREVSASPLPETLPSNRDDSAAEADRTDVPNAGTVDLQTSDIKTSEPIDPVLRNHPIPPPSEPMQYRAIGLVRGRYMPTAEQLTMGTLVTSSDETVLPAVLLGRVISLVKNHLDLQHDHLWVVYPRIGHKFRTEPDLLHVQIVGVWEPELLNKQEPSLPVDSALSETDDVNTAPSGAASLTPEPEDGYFSIRGEVVFYAEETDQVVVKIQQSPRKNEDEGKAFKLNLRGTLTGKVLGHFWSLDVQRQGDRLVGEHTADRVVPRLDQKGPVLRVKLFLNRSSGTNGKETTVPSVEHLSNGFSVYMLFSLHTTK
jgi:hypothetical protein